ncbi:MAG: AAA family ATPase [Thermodesulfovibrionales bacterium]
MRTQEELISLCKELFTTTDDIRMLVRLCPNRDLSIKFMEFWRHRDQFAIPTPNDDSLRIIEEVSGSDEDEYPLQDVVKLGPDEQGRSYWIDRETNEVVRTSRTVVAPQEEVEERPGDVMLCEDIWCEIIGEIGRKYHNLTTKVDRENALGVICGSGNRANKSVMQQYLALLCAFGCIGKSQIDEIMKARSNTSQSSEKQTLFLDTIYDLPYGLLCPINKDIDAVRRVLDATLYGLNEVKAQIMDYFTLMIHSGGRGITVPILLIGEPGTGKTSIARAISAALGLPFYSFSLGGASDNAVFRGHHSSWSESTPGGIVRLLVTTGCCNPVVLFDEIDKAGESNYGAIQDIVSELLDPVQSAHFRDNYLGFEMDLSKCLYVLTANDKHKIPSYLLDRCEVLEVRQYTPSERAEIIEKHLVSQVILENFLKIKVDIEDDAIEKLSLIPSLREVKRILRSSIAKVLSKVPLGERPNIILTGETVDVKGHKEKQRIGFASNKS